MDWNLSKGWKCTYRRLAKHCTSTYCTCTTDWMREKWSIYEKMFNSRALHTVLVTSENKQEIRIFIQCTQNWYCTVVKASFKKIDRDLMFANIVGFFSKAMFLPDWLRCAPKQQDARLVCGKTCLWNTRKCLARLCETRVNSLYRVQFLQGKKKKYLRCLLRLPSSLIFSN